VRNEYLELRKTLSILSSKCERCTASVRRCEALAEWLELALNRSVRLSLELPRTRSVRISGIFDKVGSSEIVKTLPFLTTIIRIFQLTSVF